MASSDRGSIEKVSPSEKADDTDVDVRVLANPEDKFDPSFVKRTIRKVDLRLLPILAALYAFSLIDRTNISLARVIGMQQELQLGIGDRYSIVALVFFPPYIVLEFPSNIVLRKFGPRWWLGFIATVWGATMLSMGFVKNWEALAGCRAILGALEAGFFPGCVYLITTWYKRQEVQKRLAIFYLLSSLVGGFSAIFAYGVSTIKVAFGLYAWRWIFIICGAITSFLGLLSFFLIVDFPDEAKFLSREEAKLIIDRVQYDRGDAIPDKLTWAKAAQYACEPKLWAFGIMFMCSTIPSYAFSFFLPAILSGMGFSVKDSQLLAAPPYGFAAVFGIFVAYFADKTNKRGPFIIFQALVTIVGLAMIAFAKSNAARYAGAFLGQYGCLSNTPAILAYQSNNIVGQSKRAFASALVVAFGGIGGIVASTTFREQDAPRYIPGLWTSIGCQILMIACCVACSTWFAYRNNQVRRGTSSKPIEGHEGFLFTL